MCILYCYNTHTLGEIQMPARNSYLKNTSGGDFVEQKFGGTLLTASQETSTINPLQIKDSAVPTPESTLRETSRTKKLIKSGEFGKLRPEKYIIFGSVENIAGLTSSLLSILGGSSFSSAFSSVRNIDKIIFTSFKFRTTNLSNQYFTPLLADDGVYDFVIYWGDGTSDHVTTTINPSTGTNWRKFYAGTGQRDIEIKGIIKNTGMKYWYNVQSISDFGRFKIDSKQTFSELQYLESMPYIDLPRTTTDLTETFQKTWALDMPDISRWNTSNVTNMTSMFQQAYGIEGINLSKWNTSNVTSMKQMFSYTLSSGRSAENLGIEEWDVGKVTDFRSMFTNCSDFNLDISNWDTSSAEIMAYMFHDPFFDPTFNPNNGRTNQFNQPIGKWDVSNVTNMEGMFKSWFFNTTLFNQPLNDWDVSSVTNMKEMFYGLSDFNQPLSNWNTSNVQTMARIFAYMDSFDQDISNWDFSGLNTSNSLDAMASTSSFSPANYDALLQKWASQASVMPSMGNVNMGTSRYSSAGSVARSSLVDTYGWTILDGGSI